MLEINEQFHTHDEDLRDELARERTPQYLAAVALDSTVQRQPKTTDAQRNEPYEYFGFGD